MTIFEIVPTRTEVATHFRIESQNSRVRLRTGTGGKIKANVSDEAKLMTGAHVHVEIHSAMVEVHTAMHYRTLTYNQDDTGIVTEILSQDHTGTITDTDRCTNAATPYLTVFLASTQRTHIKKKKRKNGVARNKFLPLARVKRAVRRSRQWRKHTYTCRHEKEKKQHATPIPVYCQYILAVSQ